MVHVAYRIMKRLVHVKRNPAEAIECPYGTGAKTP